MSVWCAVVASISYMYMVSPEYEIGNIVKAILAFVYTFAFIGGIYYGADQKDKIKKLESEVKKLKENLNHIKD